MNIEDNDVIGLKTGYDYSKLDKDSGLIRENEPVDEKTIVIGKLLEIQHQKIFILMNHCT